MATQNDPLTGISSSGSWLMLAAVVMVCATALLATLSASTSAPLVLTVLAVFATIGVFAVFGLIAGHLRVSERLDHGELTVALADRVPHGLLVTAPDQRVLYANRAATQLLGRTGLGETRAPDQAFAGEPEAAQALFRLSRAAGRGDARSEEIRVSSNRASAPARVIRISVKPFSTLRFDAIAGPGALWTLEDVSEERASQAEQRRLIEARLAAFEESPAGLIAIDADGRIAQISADLQSKLGFDHDRGQRELFLVDLIAGDGAELLRAVGRDGGDRDTEHAIEIDLVREDGVSWPVRMIARAGSEPGSVVAVVLGRDVDEGGVLLDGSKGDAGRLFRNAPFGIATIGADERITSANGAFVRLLMRTGTLTGQPAVEVLAAGGDEGVHKAVAAALMDAAKGRAHIEPVEISLGAKGEFTRRLFVSPAAQRKSGGGTIMVYLLDATEQKALEQKFAQSQKMEAVGQLAGGIAHDFNNALTAIIGFSDLLLPNHRPGDPSYKNIKAIKSSAERSAAMVKQLLAYSRKQQLTQQALQLGEFIPDQAMVLNRLLGEKVELKIHSGRDLWLVKADPSELNRALWNLTKNAGDAMPDGGTLTIRTRNVSERESQRLVDKGLAVGEYVSIEIEDTGSGMPPEILSRIFEPFFTTKGVGKGTGLGLSTIYGSIKQIGGYIYVDSTVGKGTTFRLYLPRYHEDESGDVVAQPEPKAAPRDLTGVGRVLVVEDEDAVRMFATEALSRQGYEVIQASDGFEALELMEENDFAVDLVVSDVMMPEMDGPTLMKEVRKTRPDLKFIFVSGYPDEAFNASLDPNAKFTFLPKPYSLVQIAEKVKEVIGT